MAMNIWNTCGKINVHSLQAEEVFNTLTHMTSVYHHGRISFLLILILAIPVTLIFSCKDSATDPGQPINIAFPDSNVSYSQYLEPLFQQGCAFSSCHGTASQGGLNLESPSYSKLMNHQPRLVVSTEGNNSLLVQRLDGRVQPQMPFNRTALTQNQINGIKKWIDEGAINN